MRTGEEKGPPRNLGINAETQESSVPNNKEITLCEARSVVWMCPQIKESPASFGLNHTRHLRESLCGLVKQSEALRMIRRLFGLYFGDLQVTKVIPTVFF